MYSSMHVPYMNINFTNGITEPFSDVYQSKLMLVGLKQYLNIIKRAPLFLIEQTLKVPDH